MPLPAWLTLTRGRVLVAAGVLGTTWFLALRGKGADSPAEPLPVPSAAPVAPPRQSSLDRRTLGWSAGHRYSYRLKLGSKLTLNDASPSFDFDVTGLLALEVFRATPEVVTLHGTLAEAGIVSRVQGSQPEFDRLAAELGRTAFFFTLRGGRVTELRVPNGTGPLVVNVYRTVAAAFQIARSSRAEVEYVAEEYDSTGKYVAKYELSGDGSLSKKKQRYLELVGTQASPANVSSLKLAPRVVVSEGRVMLAPDGRATGISLRDELRIEGAQAPVGSHSTLSLDAVSVAPAPASKLEDVYTAMHRIPAAAAYGDTPSAEALDRSRIKGLTFADALRRLEERASKGGAAPSDPAGADDTAPPPVGKEDSELFIALAAIFRQQPATVQQALQKIRAGSAATPALLDALGSASSPEAQDALIELMTSPSTNAKLRSRAGSVLVRTNAPTDRAIGALKALLVKEPFNPKALYGLGTFSRRLRDTGDEKRAGELGEFLVTKLAAASTVSSIITMLRSIANSGYAGALPKVMPLLTDKREQVRVDAVRSLQSMKDPRVDGLIAGRVTSDASSAVRISGIQAAQVREPTDSLVRGLLAATSAGDPHVRYRAVEVLLRWAPRRPELKAELERLAASDQERRIRERISSGLASPGGAG